MKLTITDLGRQFICQSFGDSSFCCVKAGLSWYYTVAGNNYNETGGTAQIVSRLASGLVDSLTMTNPARGTFTQADLNNANGSTVTLQDAQVITQHDEPTEDQWCFIPCEAWTSQADCLMYGCYWYNGACHTNPPSCSELNNQADCLAYNCYWYNGSCHDSPPACEILLTQTECASYGCYWYNGSCHTNAPSCPILDNESDCALYGCYWYRNACHAVDQPELCYWIDTKGGPSELLITDVFQLIDAYIFQAPISGWTFVPIITEVFGVIDYYLGFNGDGQTGCSYYA